jgi:solute carrier family 25 oxoglutarate transporter 11
LQLGSTGGPIGTAAAIVKNEGFGALYTGLSAGLLRQATYTTARLGLHSQFVNALKESNKGENLSLAQKAGAGLAAGGLGAIVGSPAATYRRMVSADYSPAPGRRAFARWR